MSVVRLYNLPTQFFSNAGVPLANGRLFFYLAGLSTKTTTYSESTGSTPNSNPITLDSNGRVTVEVWVTAGIAIKVGLAAAGSDDPPAQFIRTEDNITPNANTLSSNLTFLALPTNAVTRNVQDKLQDSLHIFDFMTAAQIADARNATLSLDLTTPIQNALNYFNGTGRSGFISGELVFDGVCKITAPLYYVGSPSKSLHMRGLKGGNRGGATGTALKWGGSTATSMFIFNGANNSIIEKINFVDPSNLLTNVIHLTADNIWNTTVTNSFSAGTQTITVGSTANMAVGTAMSIGSGTTYEIVYITAVPTGTTFTANFLYAHGSGEQVGNGAGNEAVLMRDCSLSLGESASSVGILTGNVASGSTMQVSDVDFFRISCQGNGAGAGTGIKIITGGNVKCFKLDRCNLNNMATGIDITAASGAYQISRCQFANITSKDIGFGQGGNLLVEACESESTGNRFISGTGGANPGSIVAISNAWQCACASDDICISSATSLTLIGNDFRNTRTGSSIPIIQVNDIGYGSTGPTNITSIGNRYQHATATSLIFQDTSANGWNSTTYFPSSAGAVTPRLMSLNDQGGNAGSMINLPAFIGGLKNLSQIPSFSVHRNGTNQTGIVTATPTKVQFTTEEFDVGAYFDNATNYRYTPLVAGKYLITWAVYFITSADQSVGALGLLYKNGSSYKEAPLALGSGTGDTASGGSAVVSFNGTTDYIELFASQSTGSNKDISGASTKTYLTGVYLGA